MYHTHTHTHTHLVRTHTHTRPDAGDHKNKSEGIRRDKKSGWRAAAEQPYTRELGTRDKNKARKVAGEKSSGAKTRASA